MNCDACGFDMTGGPGESGRCEGCGTPLAPAADHDKPGPGFRVEAHDKPYIVTEADREQYPGLEAVTVIREKKIKWGRGIGAETYGYYVKDAEEVVNLSKFDKTDHDECPECESERAVHEYGFDGCVASFGRLRCVFCDHEYYEHFDC